MVDNTTLNVGSGGDVIATDDLTTLNGGAVSGVKAQRVKVGYGVDADFTDASKTNPLPTQLDGVLDNLTTTASVTSATNVVSVSTAGYNGGSFQVTNAGTSCTVTYEQSNDNTNWTSMLVVNPAVNTNTPIQTSSATGLYNYAISAAFVRARVSTYGSGTVTISLTQKRNAPLTTGLSLQAGTSAIGNIGTVQTVVGAAYSIPFITTDVIFGAIISTTTTSAIVPDRGCSYAVLIPVQTVSGTSPTLDIVLQESDDQGTSWFDVYHFPRITAAGTFRSPTIALTGQRVRYIQTVNGTTPSFSRTIYRIPSNNPATYFRRIFDRSLASTQTLGATTATMVVAGTTHTLQLVIAAGAITTTAPALQLQGSDDGGATWYNFGSPLLSIANTTVQTSVADVNADLVRAIVTTAGSLATLTYVALKAF
jgi:hypothetical protein